jgi:hypothetical protein
MKSVLFSFRSFHQQQDVWLKRLEEQNMFSRRTFLKYTGGTALTLFAFGHQSSRSLKTFVISRLVRQSAKYFSVRKADYRLAVFTRLSWAYPA